MRHLRPHFALLAVAALVAACSGPPGTSPGGQSQGGTPSTGSQPSQAAASSGGGGGGANGSITYQITGDYTASGELPFQPAASLFNASLGGWQASFADTAAGTKVISLTTVSQGRVLTFGDGTAVVVGVSDSSSGSGCTFTVDKNDAGGLSGHIDCTSAGVVQPSGTGKAHLTADWDAHP